PYLIGASPSRFQLSSLSKFSLFWGTKTALTSWRPTQGGRPTFSVMSKRKVVGIDLGTTFSAIAHIDAYGKPQIIPNTDTERITPSVIFFDSNKVIVGTVVKNTAVAEAEKVGDFVK